MKNSIVDFVCLPTNDSQVAEKVNAALENDMHVIFCFGEELEDRKSEAHFDLVSRSVSSRVSLSFFSDENY